MEKITCPDCQGTSVKNGFQNDKQRYKCKVCNKRFQYCTNKIERMNLTLRTHIKRLSRKTICFSRTCLL